MNVIIYTREYLQDNDMEELFLLNTSENRVCRIRYVWNLTERNLFDEGASTTTTDFGEAVIFPRQELQIHVFESRRFSASGRVIQEEEI